MKRILAFLTAIVFVAAWAQPLQPKGIIVNPTPPQDLQVRVWVDRDPNKTSNPVYEFGSNIRISVQVTQQAYVYLFSVRATGEISGILPNAFESESLMQAGELRTFPGPNAQYTFTVTAPVGQDRVLAVASKTPLDLSQILDIQSGQAKIQGADNLARSLSIVVTPIPRNSWVSDEAFYYAGQFVAPQPTTGTLNVGSSPAGAQVLINGRSIGMTPLSAELQPGSYTLELRRSGYNVLRSTVTIQAGQTTQANYQMVAIPPPTGTLAVVTNPSGAQVLVNDKLVGTSPLTLKLNTGSYTVELRRQGYTAYRTNVNIQSGRTVRLSVSLVAVVQPVQPVRPAPSGSLTYTCQGGTLVVNYISSNQLRLFYDGNFQVLNLIRNNPDLVYSNDSYTWQLGQTGQLTVRGQVALSGCRL